MKWEYKTVKFGAVGFLGVQFDEQKINEYLNKLGESGWELVSSFDLNEGDGNSLYIVMIFKKPLAN